MGTFCCIHSLPQLLYVIAQVMSLQPSLTPFLLQRHVANIRDHLLLIWSDLLSTSHMLAPTQSHHEHCPQMIPLAFYMTGLHLTPTPLYNAEGSLIPKEQKPKRFQKKSKAFADGPSHRHSDFSFWTPWNALDSPSLQFLPHHGLAPVTESLKTLVLFSSQRSSVCSLSSSSLRRLPWTWRTEILPLSFITFLPWVFTAGKTSGPAAFFLRDLSPAFLATTCASKYDFSS